MPWTEQDYPASMKNLTTIVRRKAIDIANAMITEGYDEDTAIPVAISQAKEWAADASEQDKADLKDKDITKHKKDAEQSAARLQDQDVEVIFDADDQLWKVISQGAKRADSTHDTKKQAEARARQIAENKDVDVISHKKSD